MDEFRRFVFVTLRRFCIIRSITESLFYKKFSYVNYPFVYNNIV